MKYYLLSAHFPDQWNYTDSSVRTQLKAIINPSYQDSIVCDSLNAQTIFNLEKNHFTYSNPLSVDLLKKGVKYPDSWNHIGCWKWKPLIINHILKKIPEGSFLLYHDINMKKYPEYIENISICPTYFTSLMDKKSVLLMSQGYKPLLADSKRYILKKYNMDSILLRYLPGFWSGCIAFVKNNKSLDFCAEWVKYVTDDNFFPLPDVAHKNKFKRFVHHSSCQASLALTYYKNPKLRENISVAYSKFGRNIRSYNTGYLGLLNSDCITKYAKSIFKSLIYSDVNTFRD